MSTIIPVFRESKAVKVAFLAIFFLNYMNFFDARANKTGQVEKRSRRFALNKKQDAIFYWVLISVLLMH